MMNRRSTPVLVCAALTLAACAAPDAGSFESAPLDTNDQKASYGIGLNIGGQLADANDRLDRAAFMRGIEDAMQGNDPDVSPQELQTVLQQFGAEIQAAAAEERAQAGEENAAAGEAYLTENGARDGVTTTESGLQYEVLSEGSGETPEMGQTVRLHYRGSLIDGEEFDTSYDGEPVEFEVGRLIQGFNEALMLMAPGSHYRIVIPSNIAYGPNGSGGAIGPNATLVFEIELFEIVG